MKREILFRGKVTSLPLYLQDKMKVGSWVYGSYVSYPLAQIFDLEDEYIVDSATVGQFTGLYDKNGKKIFEGDVVGCWDVYHENYAKGEVIKKITGEWLFYPYLQYGRFWSLFSNDIGECPVEVIGNIHDNPELVKKEEAE